LIVREIVHSNIHIFATMKNEHCFDIAIIGAGPSGCSAALTLRSSQCSIALFEKSEFPRNKICGDGICDRSVNTLKAINPAYFDEFIATQQPLCIRNTELTYKNYTYTVDFKNFGYTCKRRDFDNFLFSLVQRDGKNISIFQNCGIRSVERTSEGMNLIVENGETFFAKIVLVCTGATSKIARELTGSQYDSSKMGVAVRAYYSGVKNLTNDTLELHYKKEFFPGYLWIFPLNDGTANVGFGCRIGAETKQNDIRAVFESWLANDDHLRQRFADATMISPLQGGLVPYNVDEFTCCSDNFCVCGDAANLIDPISGGGIGSAMVSGYFAAQVAEQCIVKNDCSHSATKEYEKMLRQRVEREMHTRYVIQKTIKNHPWTMDVLAFVGKQARLLQKIKSWYFQ